MADESDKGELTPDELESQEAEALPDREAMSVVWVEPDIIPDAGAPGGKEIQFEEAVDEQEPLRGGEQL